jgi:putative hydrolase of the HAD superfamily
LTELRNISALLFDLGGVLIDIDFERALLRWSNQSHLPVTELRRRFSMDEAYQQHERGEIPANEYFAHLRQILELDASDTDIERGWNDIFVGEIATTISYVASVKTKLPCYLFSNTNPTHQVFWSNNFPTAIESFQRIFVSSELGLRKPDPQAFEAIATETGFRLDETLFFDDSEENVTAARRTGMPSVLVRDHSDVAIALTSIGVL